MSDLEPQLPDNPLHTLARWARQAEESGEPSARTMTFASADADGHPHARTVLTTVIDDASVRFHTSRPTVKTTDIAANPRACGVFHWPGLARQVVLEGTTRELDADGSRAAFRTRPHQLRALAWVHEDLAAGTPVTAVDPERVRQAFAHHAAADPLSMPPSWTTILLVPERVVLWIGHGPDQAPARVRFDRSADGWTHRHVLP